MTASVLVSVFVAFFCSMDALLKQRIFSDWNKRALPQMGPCLYLEAVKVLLHLLSALTHVWFTY